MSETPQQFAVDTQQYGSTVFVRLSGEFDVSVEEDFDREVRMVEQEAQTIVIDLSELTFIDSSGLRALLRAWQRAGTDGHDMAVVPGSNQVKKALALTGLDAVLPIAAEGDVPASPLTS